ncbi:MAG: gliding motility protein [Opitutaceae bacterium]|nr:gliding motility protein [Opitutaceae bacterium]
MDLKALERAIRQRLTDATPDEVLRADLETLAQGERNFSGFTWLWGPVLYQRNRVLFRPFILAHFGQHTVTKWRFQRVAWKGAVAEALEPWLADVDAMDDVELFQRLYPWKLGDTAGWLSGTANKQIHRELVARFTVATTRAAREVVVRKFGIYFDLDEPTALALYRAEPAVAGPFILRHLPWAWRENKRPFWTELLAESTRRGDERFHDELYRRQVPREVWIRDALALAKSTRDPEGLGTALERIHPKTGWDRNLGDGLLQLIEVRGRDVLPYVVRHLRDVRHGFVTGGDYAKLLTLARERGWWDLWSAAVRVCATPKEFNAEIAALLAQHTARDSDVTARLAALTGVSREWNWAGLGLAANHQLDEANALVLLRRFPHLLRGPFLQHLQVSPWSGSYSKLIDALIAAGEDDLLDHVAARIVTRMKNAWAKTNLLTEADRLADHYAALKQASDETTFSRRAASVLGRVPAFTIQRYGKLIQENRLARLLFERSATAYLADARSVRDLVEASEIHVMALAYRVLGFDDERARILAVDNLSLLLGTLLRVMHRATRELGFRALRNAAMHDAAAATRVLAKAREALDLPDMKYPKEALLGLIAAILARWPELRGSQEAPVVFRKPAA